MPFITKQYIINIIPYYQIIISYNITSIDQHHLAMDPSSRMLFEPHKVPLSKPFIEICPKDKWFLTTCTSFSTTTSKTINSTIFTIENIYREVQACIVPMPASANSPKRSPSLYCARTGDPLTLCHISTDSPHQMCSSDFW